jgi:hypothetical protein
MNLTDCSLQRLMEFRNRVGLAFWYSLVAMDASF